MAKSYTFTEEQFNELVKSFGTSPSCLNHKSLVKSNPESLDYTPIAIPAGCTLPETMEQRIAKIMYSSGAIDRVSYENTLGIKYDETIDDDEYDEDFPLSQHAEYMDSLNEELPAPQELATTSQEVGVKDSQESVVSEVQDEQEAPKE